MSIFKQFDTNNDGVLTRDEIRGRLQGVSGRLNYVRGRAIENNGKDRSKLKWVDRIFRIRSCCFELSADDD